MKLMNKDEFIAYELKFYFMKNKLKEGEKLPSERDLAEQFGVQRATVRSAYKLLEDEGIIECRERSGNYIAHRRMISNLDRIRSFSEKLEKMGAQTRSRLLAFERVEVDKELNKSIKLPLGTPLFKITRIRMVVEEDRAVPITIEYSYIPESKAPKLMRFDLEDNSLFDILIQEYHHIPKKQELTVGIVYADENEAKALNADFRLHISGTLFGALYSLVSIFCGCFRLIAYTGFRCHCNVLILVSFGRIPLSFCCQCSQR